jgi:drug/metabolite transporter (DMT)-like permease
VSALVAAVLAAGVLLVAPIYSSGRTLLEANGAGAAWTLVAPIVVAAAAAFARGRRRRAVTVSAAALLVIFCVAVSTGLFFLPAAVMLVLAARAMRHRPA